MFEYVGVCVCVYMCVCMGLRVCVLCVYVRWFNTCSLSFTH